MSKLVDIANLHDIQRFVDQFYRRIQEDDLLGPIFDRIAKVKWELHLELMYRFWDTVLFGSGTYKGNPLVAHQEVNRNVIAARGRELGSEDFERWKLIFCRTLDGLFVGPKAEQAKRSAERMASHLQMVCGKDFQEGPLRLVP